MGSANCCSKNDDEKEYRGFKAMNRENIEVKIVILGLDNSGKTAIFDKLSGQDRLDDLAPTKGYNKEKIEYENGFKIDLWEVGGSKEVRPYWKNYFKNADGIIFVVDSTDFERFDEAALTF